MNRECLCDLSSEECSDEKKEEPPTSNRIFLNFTREYRHPAKDRYNHEKIKELFRYLRERQDLQEMKVFGWLDDKKETDDRDKEEKTEGGEDEDENVDEDEDENGGERYDKNEFKDGVESYYNEETSRRGGGQRFAMSRDFWYRKLNTLKARKLDEAALEAKDIPPREDTKDPKTVGYINSDSNKIYADEVPERKEDILADIDEFNRRIARPVERELKTKFVNVYESRDYFRSDPN